MAFDICSFLLLSPSHRTSRHQIFQAAPLPAVFLSNTTMRASSSRTCLTCRSTTSLLSSGVLTLSSLWGSVPLPGPLPPTTGLSPSRMIYPCSPCVLASYVLSGRLLHGHQIGSTSVTMFVSFVAWAKHRNDWVDHHHCRYHVGSLAFGALILTLVQLVRIILEYIDHKTKCKLRYLLYLFLCFRLNWTFEASIWLIIL